MRVITIDWVVTYYFIFIILGLIGESYFHGKPKDEKHDVVTYIFKVIFNIPVFGRIFGWW